MLGASTKIVEIMEHVPLMNTVGGEKVQQLVGEHKIKNITFCFPTKTNVTVLKDVNIDIQHNKVIALVGESGMFCILHTYRWRQVYDHSDA